MRGKRIQRYLFALAFGAENRLRQKYLFALERLKTKNPRRERGVNKLKRQ